MKTDSDGLSIDYYTSHFRSGAMESGEEVITEASHKLRLNIDDDGGIEVGNNGLKLDLKTNGGIVYDTTANADGIKIKNKSEDFEIDPSGADVGELKLKYPILSIDAQSLAKTAANVLKVKPVFHPTITTLVNNISTSSTPVHSQLSFSPDKKTLTLTVIFLYMEYPIYGYAYKGISLYRDIPI